MDEKELVNLTSFWGQWLEKIIFSVVVIVVAFCCYFVVKKLINSFLKRVDKQDSRNINKKKTVLKLLRNIFKYVFIILTVLIILQIFGVNVTSIIAGLGIATAVIGLAFQDALKDIIMGFNIIIDDYYSVGDIITVGDIHGTVVELGLKATKIKDFDTDDIHVIGNRNIVSSQKDSELILADVPMPYEESVETVEKALAEIMEISKNDEAMLKDITYVGISSYGDSAVYYRLKIYAEPQNKYQVRRNIYRIIKNEMDKRNISIPYMQVDIHNK
jgi:small conductance mechanosensitive channel